MKTQRVTKKCQCPVCGCDKFISELNQYDVLQFRAGNFEVTHTENINGEIQIFCRECGVEIDEQASEIKGKIIAC